MGLFNKIFGRPSTIERQLEEFYVQMLQAMHGMSFSEAKDMARMMIKEAKQDSEKEGTAQLPQSFGDILLEKETSDEKIKCMLAKLRREGVRDEDIKWWWNMHDLERRMLQQADLMYRRTRFLKLLEEGLSPQDATRGVAKHFPIFGDPDDTTLGSGDDRPLPYELKDRINIYIQKRGEEKLKKAIEYSTSANSLIRKAIRKGRI